MAETAQPETFEFQAEVKQVLDIVVHSLYTDKEIFIRELISNASDALEKLRHTQITEQEVFDDTLPLEIKVSGDEEAGTITIQDFGIGMTREELVENLGTIAHSGSKAFIQALKEGGANNENLIGQFGVGFYSAFMVADKVEVFTRRWRKEAEGQHWNSEGGAYTIGPSEGERRGCKIVVHLKDEYKDFAKADRIKGIVKRYSAFVQFPVLVDEEKVNTIQAIWMKNKSEVSDEEYKEFYKFQANAFDEPMQWMHFSADAPLALHALLFVPTQNQERFGFGRMEPAVALHCRKVLIDSEPKGLLPEWLRFLKGVIDSADLPLNISRERMQDSALIQKISQVITKRFLKFLGDLAKKKPEDYKKFYTTWGTFLKEGVTSDFTHRDGLAKLMRFESSMLEANELTGFEDYLTRMKDGQKEIYYVYGQNRAAIEAGPYVEAFKARNLEVLYCYEPIDEFVMSHLGQFEEKSIRSADSEEIELESIDESATEALTEDEQKALSEWLKSTLGEGKVSKVESSTRLVESPAVILNADKMMTAHMRRLMKQMNPDQEFPEPPVSFQINPRHPLIKNLNALRTSDPETAQLMAEQIFDNSRVTAGILEDPKDMLQRSYKLMERLSSK